MLLALVALTSLAQESVSLSGVTTMSPCDSDRPSLTFHAHEPGAIDAVVDCGGHTFRASQAVSSGADVKLELRVPPGEYTCTGDLTMALDNGATVQLPLNLDIACLPVLEWKTSQEDVDIAANTLVVHPSRPLVEATMEIYGADGGVALTSGADLSDPSNPTFSWSGDLEEVKILVQGKDKQGFAGFVELTPWYYDIPHEDVVFASGSHAIDGPEMPKLNKTWTDTVDVMNKYGSIIQIELYVGGYTDTMGGDASNLALSERRAKSIASWFRNSGFGGAIYYQGFGERGQAVQTADGVDEVRNRRAIYILAAERPPSSPDLPGANWKRL